MTLVMCVPDTWDALYYCLHELEKRTFVIIPYRDNHSVYIH